MSLSTTTIRPADALASQAELERIFAGWHSALLGMLYFLLGSWEEARICMQETFSYCWRSRRELVDVADVKSWVFAHALKTARAARSDAWKKAHASLDSTQITYDLDAATESQLPYNGYQRRLRISICELPDAEREVFLLRENGDFTYEEIAELLRLPVAKVKFRMRYALELLRSVTVA